MQSLLGLRQHPPPPLGRAFGHFWPYFPQHVTIEMASGYVLVILCGLIPGTDTFRDDVHRYCATNGNCDIKLQVDKLVDIFQKIIPRIKHFLERKFDLDIREQDGVFNEKEMELAEMEEEKNKTDARFKVNLQCRNQRSEKHECSYLIS